MAHVADDLYEAPEHDDSLPQNPPPARNGKVVHGNEAVNRVQLGTSSALSA